jgi:hypothetical protein
MGLADNPLFLIFLFPIRQIVQQKTAHGYEQGRGKTLQQTCKTDNTMIATDK